jgi:hypothetical protein
MRSLLLLLVALGLFAVAGAILHAASVLGEAMPRFAPAGRDPQFPEMMLRMDARTGCLESYAWFDHEWGPTGWKAHDAESQACKRLSEERAATAPD